MDLIEANRKRIVDDLQFTACTRRSIAKGLLVLPDQFERAFKALADAGDFNRAHPSLRIEPATD